MQNSKLILAGAGLTIAVAYGVLNSASAAKPSDLQNDDVEQLRAEVASLRRAVSTQSAVIASPRLGALAAGSAAAQVEAASDESENAPREEAPPKRPELDDKQMLDRMDSSFDSEPTDPTWSAKATPLAHEHVRTRLPAGSRLKSLECRATICRAETTHQNLDAYREYMNGAMSGTDRWLGPSMVTLTNAVDSAVLESTAYLVKSGDDMVRIMEATEDVE